MKKYLFALSLIVSMLSLESCYRFNGISIPPEVSSYYVGDIELKAFGAPAGIEVTFRDELIKKINTTRIRYNESNPDVEYQGSITSYRVSAVAPQQLDEVSTEDFTRLSISVKMTYENHLDEDDNWEQTFSFNQDYESNNDLSSIQDELISTIFDQILQDIYNKSFTNW